MPTGGCHGSSRGHPGLGRRRLAHVEVIADTATQGGETTFAFQVANEEETADTTTIQVQLPADRPLGSASVKQHPGWTATVTKAKLATPIKADDGEV